MPARFPLMLFAAGFGTRMGALTASQPKPLVQVAGHALIDHALRLVDQALVGPVVINLHYRGDQIRQHLQTRDDLSFSDEAPDILETGGGLRHALPLLGPGPVMTLNSDAVWTGPNPLRQLAAAWDGARMDGLLLMCEKPRATGHTGRGDFIADAEGRLTRGPGDIYVGAQILRTDILRGIADKSFSMNRVWDLMEARSRLFGVKHQGGWCDVGQPSSIPLAEDLLNSANV